MAADCTYTEDEPLLFTGPINCLNSFLDATAYLLYESAAMAAALFALQAKIPEDGSRKINGSKNRHWHEEVSKMYPLFK